MQGQTKQDIPFSFVGTSQMLETCANFGLAFINSLQSSSLLSY